MPDMGSNTILKIKKNIIRRLKGEIILKIQHTILMKFGRPLAIIVHYKVLIQFGVLQKLCAGHGLKYYFDKQKIQNTILMKFGRPLANSLLHGTIQF